MLSRSLLQGARIPIAPRAFLRYASTTEIVTEKKDTSLGLGTKSRKKKQQRPTINKVGVPHDPYIPVSYNHLKLSQPGKVLRALWNRVKLFAFNWVQVYQFKSGMGKGYKPQFIAWKNKAITEFVRVNKAFSERRIESIRDEVSEFVYFQLGKRQAALPNALIEWELVKFNSPPKLLSFNAFPHEDGSTLLCQIIYKFDTKQKWIVKKRGEDKITETERDMVEYLAFNIDPYNDNVCLAGSVFEAPLDRKLESKVVASQTKALEYMNINGDIYRTEPTDEEKMLQYKD
ncbi:Inner membrane mitoribosome receptor MBA1, mitochondrial [Pichia kudriavzevii]|uniref:Inner membrane mitoribosome receptor MBA1, mitochondrial n=1 Tax=Pichia kudriavzevii TaxID=4909 RepID=A0A1V2LMV1_PICKU|nr:Inner membrane mitoribosome receptor MBA1, mitochondrial [Pichia kudriavzevii]